MLGRGRRSRGLCSVAGINGVTQVVNEIQVD
jgi:hypothetical protein